MSPRNIILMIVAVVFAAGTSMMVRKQSDAPPEQQEAAPTAQRILVAKRNVPMGAFIQPELDLDWAAWPENTIQPAHVKEGVEEATSYQGAVARRALQAGEAVTAQALVKPGAGGFLSAVLEPGKRAVSVAVTQTSGASGFIFPGDFVDLIVTHRMKVRATPQSQDEDTVISETFVENVRVVAVDQMLDNPENKAIPAKTITVEVSPNQAERVSVAEDLGRISFALRSLGSPEADAKQEVKSETTESTGTDAEGTAVGGPLMPLEESQDYVSALTDPKPVVLSHESFTRDRDISPALSRTGGMNPRVTVIRGGEVEQREFSGGGQ